MPQQVDESLCSPRLEFFFVVVMWVYFLTLHKKNQIFCHCICVWVDFISECFVLRILYSYAHGWLLLACQVDLLETGSHCNVFTAALTTRNQRQDVHSTIRHKAEGTTCLQEQRNVVADTADCVFKGRIVIDVSKKCCYSFLATLSHCVLCSM